MPMIASCDSGAGEVGGGGVESRVVLVGVSAVEPEVLMVGVAVEPPGALLAPDDLALKSSGPLMGDGLGAGRGESLSIEVVVSEAPE